MKENEWELIVGRLVVEHKQTKENLAFMEVRLWRAGEALRVAAESAIAHTSPDVNPCRYIPAAELEAMFIDYYALKERVDDLTKRRENLGI